MSSKPTFVDFITNEENSLSKLDKIVCHSNKRIGDKLRNIILNRLIDVNRDRKNKISTVTDLLACDIKDMHVSNYTCDGVVIDKITGVEARVILSRCIFDGFHKTYPMEDVRIPAMLKYISAVEDSSIRYSSSVYVRFYRYLGWIMSTWNNSCQ